jgi:hypothetical protein
MLRRVEETVTAAVARSSETAAAPSFKIRDVLRGGKPGGNILLRRRVCVVEGSRYRPSV